MKVVAILGSPRKEGNSATALNIIGNELIKDGIEFEIVHVGNKNIHGCVGCKQCAANKNERCVIDDFANEAIAKMKCADGIIISSPVYFAGIAGTMKSFLDRAFYVSASNGSMFRGKVAAAVTSVRRSGGSNTLNGLNYYITYGEMIVATSNYWNIVHGREAGEMLEDSEGVQTMEMLGRNMAWLLKMRNETTVPQPDSVTKIFTSFVK